MGRDARDTMEPYPNLFFCMEKHNIIINILFLVCVPCFQCTCN